jgi:phosphatidylglycerol---prolipoprotein diacylglyceryl transferase
MYPTLTDFFYDVFGIKIPLPIQTYGFFVAMAFIAGIILLTYELKRKEKDGLLSAITKKILIGEPAKVSAIILSAIGGFILGFKLLEGILHYSDLVKNPQEFILSLRGNIIGGIILAVASAYWTWKEKQKQKLDKPKWIDKTIFPHEMAGNILIIAAVFGLLGAKIFHNLENFDELIDDPIGSLFSFSGLTFLGGLIVGVGSVVWYARKNGIPSLYLVDAAAPALALAYGVGRLGCQISGDGCWGIPNPAPKPGWMSFLPDWMWSYNYPHNVINSGSKMLENCNSAHCHVLDVPVFPTPFYETMMMLVIFIFLWSIRKRIKAPGLMFMMFITLAGFERFFIERIRINNEYHIFGFGVTQAQILSSIMILLGIAGIIIFRKKGNQINQWLNNKMNVKNSNHEK